MQDTQMATVKKIPLESIYFCWTWGWVNHYSLLSNTISSQFNTVHEASHFFHPNIQILTKALQSTFSFNLNEGEMKISIPDQKWKFQYQIIYEYRKCTDFYIYYIKYILQNKIYRENMIENNYFVAWGINFPNKLFGNYKISITSSRGWFDTSLLIEK